MSFHCSKCSVHFKGSDLIYATVCGHCFHQKCISGCHKCPFCNDATSRFNLLELFPCFDDDSKAQKSKPMASSREIPVAKGVPRVKKPKVRSTRKAAVTEIDPNCSEKRKPLLRQVEVRSKLASKLINDHSNLLSKQSQPSQ